MARWPCFPWTSPAAMRPREVVVRLSCKGRVIDVVVTINQLDETSL